MKTLTVTEATIAGYYEIAEALLDGGAAVPELLCSAARCGHTKLALLLIRCGADVDYEPPMGTPLENAVSAGNLEVVRALIKAGADIQHQGIKGTLLTRAVDASDVEVAKELISAGVDVNAAPRFGASALLTAVTERGAEFVRLLLEAGANVNQKGSVVCGEFGVPEVKDEGRFRTTHIPNPPVAGDATPLIVATRRGYADIAAQLIAGGADVHAADAEGFTALVYALKANDEPLIKLLKDAGTSPLMEAANEGHAGAIKALIKAGADPNRFTRGMTALWYAASSGHVAAVQALLDAGADPKAGDKMCSPLEAASSDGHKDVVNLLLKHGKGGKKGAGAKKATETDKTALGSAALMGQIVIVRSLLESGADPNVAGEEHFTALMGAVRAGSIELVQMLLKAGADVNALNEQRETALDRMSLVDVRVTCPGANTQTPKRFARLAGSARHAKGVVRAI